MRVLEHHPVYAFIIATGVVTTFAQTETQWIFSVLTALFGRIGKGHVIRQKWNVCFDGTVAPSLGNAIHGLVVPGILRVSK